MADTTWQDATILVVEDDRRYRMLISDALRAHNYGVLEAEEGRATLELVASRNVDLVLLDVMLPDADGFGICQRLRDFTRVPIIMVTARAEEQHKIRGLDMGADDYLTKPFSIGELLARVRAALRRSSQHTSREDGTFFQFGKLRIDGEANRVTIKGQEVLLSPTEYRLLWFLAANAGRILVPELITSHVWGIRDENMYGTLKTTIGRLRQKLGDDPANPTYIHTRRGIGYLLVGHAETTGTEN